ncbi:EAL domain-containing protein, partial [Salmonella enterica subsp. enterica serovar Give]|nr:EAL domain-containing protein [Salmonella enterica subsp. enterica serovar Give]
LLRWQHHRRGLLTADQFMDGAHASSVVSDIGAWALEQASAQVRDWQNRYPSTKNLLVGINVSGTQLPTSNTQGFYFAKPLPPIQMERMLRSGKLPRASTNTGANR